MKNLHLEHPEDMILEGNIKVFDALYETAHLSLKIDGAPAVVFGTHPELSLIHISEPTRPY